MAKRSLESCRVDPGDGFQYLSSYQNVYRWKIEIIGKISKLFFPSQFPLRVTLKRSLRSWFSAKNTTFLNFFSETMKSCGYVFIGLVCVLWMLWHLLEPNIPYLSYIKTIFTSFPELLGHEKKHVFWPFCQF